MKKGAIIFGTLIIILLLAISVTIKSIVEKGSKEIKVATEFIEDLRDKNIIDVKINGNLSEKEITSLNRNVKLGENTQYSIMVENYGVDLDSEYNVIGFSKKDGEFKIDDGSIAKEKAIELAEKYIDYITNDEIKFKEVRKVEGEQIPFYTIVFYKYKDGYPYYEHEIVAKINKNTGKLDGYSNFSLNHIAYSNDINIKEDNAKEIVIDYLEKLNFSGEFIEEPFLAYVNVDDKKMGLVYICKVKISNKEEEFVFYINAESGDIISSTLVQ